MSAYNSLTFAPMLITEVFDTMKASTAWFDKVHLKNGEPTVPYLSQTQSGNSVAAIVADQGVSPEPGNCITITLKTQATFYHPVSFYTAQNFLIFRHESLNEFSGVVLVTILRRALEKFSWGYGVSMARLRKTRIMVPVTMSDTGEGIVDWDGLKQLGEELRAEAVKNAQAAAEVVEKGDNVDLPILTFAPMLVPDVFETMNASAAWYDKNKLTRGEGRVPYVSRSGLANGHEDPVGRQLLSPNSGNAVTIGVDTQTVFYQPTNFYTSVKIQVLRHPRLTADSGLVLVALLRSQMSKFQWGNGASLDRLQATRIMVPVTTSDSGEPVVDWDGMTAYGQALRARVERGMAQALAQPTP